MEVHILALSSNASHIFEKPPAKSAFAISYDLEHRQLFYPWQSMPRYGENGYPEAPHCALASIFDKNASMETRRSFISSSVSELVKLDGK